MLLQVLSPLLSLSLRLAQHLCSPTSSALPPSSLSLLTHSLAFSARGRVITSGAREAAFERRGGAAEGGAREELSQSAFCCAHYFFRPFSDSYAFAKSHYAEGRQAGRQAGSRQRWQHVRPHQHQEGHIQSQPARREAEKTSSNDYR